MSTLAWRRARVVGAAVAVAAAVVVGIAGPAAAHDPLIVDTDQADPTRPLIEDGTVSFATYGVIDAPHGSATVRLRLAEGQELYLQLLVPDQAPENTLTDFSHLLVTITPPSGEGAGLVAGPVVDRFSEEFSKTDYLILLEHTQPAEAGVTEVTVSSEVPTRFTLATGRTEQFGTAVSDYTRRPFTDLAAWYATPPGAAGSTSSLPPSANPTIGAAPSSTASATSDPSDPSANIAGTATSTKPSDADEGSEPDSDDGDGGGSGTSPWLVGAGIVAAAAVGAAVWARRRRGPPDAG